MNTYSHYIHHIKPNYEFGSFGILDNILKTKYIN